MSLIISNTVLFGLKDPNKYSYRFLDNVKVKGKKEADPVYDVFDADPPEIIDMKVRIREPFEKGVY